uniref:Uncharacterized protein n=1 Tax=Timema bartmani TaxID=61472 RepID=A0A7R9F3J3_9NEOP|nr:unnamed protein product [Timema bartmani]
MFDASKTNKLQLKISSYSTGRAKLFKYACTTVCIGVRRAALHMTDDDDDPQDVFTFLDGLVPLVLSLPIYKLVSFYKRWLTGCIGIQVAVEGEANLYDLLESKKH